MDLITLSAFVAIIAFTIGRIYGEAKGYSDGKKAGKEEFKHDRH